jgi:hypothetical protein
MDNNTTKKMLFVFIITILVISYFIYKYHNKSLHIDTNVVKQNNHSIQNFASCLNSACDDGPEYDKLYSYNKQSPFCISDSQGFCPNTPLYTEVCNTMAMNEQTKNNAAPKKDSKVPKMNYEGVLVNGPPSIESCNNRLCPVSNSVFYGDIILDPKKITANYQKQPFDQYLWGSVSCQDRTDNTKQYYDIDLLIDDWKEHYPHCSFVKQADQCWGTEHIQPYALLNMSSPPNDYSCCYIKTPITNT